MTLDEAKQQYQQALRGLYAAFARYPIGPRMDTCPHCGDSRSDVPLHRSALANLEPQDLAFYAFCAMTTMGDENDYRHFLPRIFELSLLEDGPDGLQLWLQGDKLAYGHWRTWPVGEQRAIEAWLMAAWDMMLHDPARIPAAYCASVGPHPRDLMSFAAGAGISLDSLLARWRCDTGPVPTAQLAAFARNCATSLPNEGRILKSADLPAADEVNLRHWLLDPAKLRALEAAFERNPDHPLAGTIAEGVDGLQWMIDFEHAAAKRATGE